MRSDNLKRHAKSCRMKNYHATPALHPTSEDSDADEDDNSEDEKSKPEVSDEDSEDSVTNNNEQPEATVKLLPATLEGLRKRFTKLWREFTRCGKHEYSLIWTSY